MGIVTRLFYKFLFSLFRFEGLGLWLLFSLLAGRRSYIYKWIQFPAAVLLFLSSSCNVLYPPMYWHSSPHSLPPSGNPPPTSSSLGSSIYCVWKLLSEGPHQSSTNPLIGRDVTLQPHLNPSQPTSTRS
jgi:hypothetical protein